ARSEHRGHGGAPGRDRPAREPGRARRPRARRRGLALLAQAARAGQHQPAPAAALCAGVEPGRERLGIPAPELAQPPRVGELRGHRRGLLRCMERPDAQPRADRVHHHPVLGTGQTL
ncbi:MAG: hypothetical protein AVDCRST_MAG04-3079, partial [uncultured Acetobacteraceae bacterium]